MNYADGERYEGMFKDGVPEGTGKLANRNGSVFVGHFSKGEPVVEVTFKSPVTGKEYI